MYEAQLPKKMKTTCKIKKKNRERQQTRFKKNGQNQKPQIKSRRKTSSPEENKKK